MSTKSKRQCGLWDSPISPRSLAEDRRLEAARWDTDGQTLVWLEGRSDRGVLVASDAGRDAPRDLTTDLDVRAEVGYGGGDFAVGAGHVYFVVHKSGRIYRQPLAGGPAKPVTPAFGKAAAPVVSPDGRWVAYVHADDENVDRIAVVDAEGMHWPQILATGHDFYMQPRWSPDGGQFCWIAWDHPNMPWDGTKLFIAPVLYNADSLPRLGEPREIAGGADVAIFQPEFTPDGRTLLYVSDETGWGRIAAHDLASGQRRWLAPDGVEFGSPAWRQDQRNYAVSRDGRWVIAAASRAGFQQIERIDLATGENQPVDELAEYTELGQVTPASAGDQVAFVASGPNVPARIVVFDFDTRETTIAARASGETVPQAALSQCKPISWATAGDELAHGLYYPPASDKFEAAEKPPLIVMIHGGPTSQVRAGWRADAQFFATRGYAVLYVNYRGGTGYGREFMLRLRGNWGVCDVEDAVSGARHLADTGEVDPQRAVIMGGSAGGFTVLQTMIDQPQAFAAGICLFGVADQFHLAAHTHKFESRYLDTLLGSLPESSAVYRQRSPMFHADKIRRPLAVFQGAIDRVVPREQSDTIVEALKRNGTPHVYHCYDGEGHGWRKKETIEHFYQAVDEFLRRHVIFT
jgi:dipeptidyl aminopeptidase/acylaminoacyl peptidase